MLPGASGPGVAETFDPHARHRQGMNRNGAAVHDVLKTMVQFDFWGERSTSACGRRFPAGTGKRIVECPAASAELSQAQL